MNTVLVNGTYVTASQVKVNSPTNGIITELFVTDNQQVQMGDKLFHVQSSATESQKRTAFAAYLTAKNTLDTASAKTVLDIFLKLNKEEKLTIIMVTHEPEYAKLAKRNIELLDGLIAKDQKYK